MPKPRNLVSGVRGPTYSTGKLKPPFPPYHRRDGPDDTLEYSVISGKASRGNPSRRAQIHWRQISPLPPVVLGGVLVVPVGLLAAMTGHPAATPGISPDNQTAAARARSIIMAIERDLGFDPTDLEFEKLGYGIESRTSGTGKAGSCSNSGQRSSLLLGKFS